MLEKLFEIIMGIKIGDVDIGRQVVENEFFIKLIDKYFDQLFLINRDLNKPTDQDVIRMRNEVIQELQKKYPHSGIEFIQQERQTQSNASPSEEPPL